MKNRKRSAQSGQAIPLLAVMITVLVGFLGLAVDSGRAYLDRRTLQNSTDAAVLTTADYYQNGYSVTQAEQYATASFEKNLQIYGGISGSPTWCTTPSGSGSCSVTVSFNSNPPTLTLGYTDRRNTGKGLVFTATGNDSLPLAFLQALKLGPNVSLTASAQTVVGDQSQNPAILVTGTSCAPSASLGVSGGETVTVVGAIYSDGGITVGGSSQVDVSGNVYATCNQSDPSGMNLSSGFAYYSPVGKLAVNYLGGVNSPYWPSYSANSQTWPSSSIETSPGVYGSNVSITGSNCTFLDNQAVGGAGEALGHFSGTALSSRCTSASASSPSARAWKLSTSRCRSTGTATARTSAKSTWNCPRRSARPLAPRIRYCAARGLAP